MKKILYLGLEVPETITKEKVEHFPVIQIAPKPFELVKYAFEAIEEYTHYIFTSKSAVKLFYDFANKCGYPHSLFRDKLCFSVGRSTTKSLKEIGMKYIRTASIETAEGITSEMDKLQLTDAFIFWPHSSSSRDIIPVYLYGRSIRFCACALYDTVVKKYTEIPDLNLFDELVFTSPSVVDAFLKIFEKFPTDKNLTGIGPITKQSLMLALSKEK